MGQSLREQLARAPELIDKLPPGAVDELAGEPWWFMARPEQLPPPDLLWHIWLILSGRGWGKTRTGAEWLADEVLNVDHPGSASPEFGIIAETFGDTRTICVEGPSGLLGVLNRRGLVNGTHYVYNRSAWQVNFADGQRIHMLGADDRDAGRGFNFAGIWADELAKWRYPLETWTEGIAPALRVGSRPRACITTTPKPIPILKEWVRRTDGSVHVTRGSTFDNAANLSTTALTEFRRRYAGTRIGRQELYGELLDDIEGALWQAAWIWHEDKPPALRRVVVAVDPATTYGPDADETGIVVCGVDTEGHFWVLADLSGRYAPADWARIVAQQVAVWGAHEVVAEGNQGGQMVKQVLIAAEVPTRVRIVHAKVSKQARAEPIAALYEQRRVSHLRGLDVLELQLTEWVPDKGAVSPDRLDAAVWGLTALSGREVKPVRRIAT